MSREIGYSFPPDSAKSAPVLRSEDSESSLLRGVAFDTGDGRRYKGPVAKKVNGDGYFRSQDNGADAHHILGYRNSGRGHIP